MSRWVAAAALVLTCHASPLGGTYAGDALLPTALGSSDPVASVEVSYPVEGAVEKPPVAFKTMIHIRPGAVELFTDQYSGRYLCVETTDLDRARIVSHSCAQINGPAKKFQQQEPGNFSVQAYITEDARAPSSHGKPHWQSTTVAFSVVSETAFDAQIAQRVVEEGEAYPDFELGVVEWAAKQQRQRSGLLLEQLAGDSAGLTAPTTVMNQSGDVKSDLVLVVGIKTAVATNFAIRQAIRQTWARKAALPAGVKVFFIGCRPFSTAESSENATIDDTSADLERLWRAIQLEKLVFGDLLTDELDCDDSYADLADKVKAFLHFTATQYPDAQYVMVADDDLYVRMDQVLHTLTTKASPTRYYSGQVRAIENAQKERPVRVNDGAFRYVLTMAQYPMHELPPFAIGAYFFLSMDCVQFISKNRNQLRDLSGMDDMSMSLWLLAIQVLPQSFGRLEHLRGGACSDDLVALGDLSPLSIRVVHDNLLNGRRMCHGFNHHLWMKPPSLAPPQGSSYKLSSATEPLQYELSLRDPSATYALEISTHISTRSLAGIKLFIFPSLETPENVFRRTCAAIRLSFPGSAGSLPCSEIVRGLRNELQSYSKRLNDARIMDSSRLALWRYNLFGATNFDAAPLIVAYAPSASFSRVVLECLFMSVFEEQKRPLLVMPDEILHKYYDQPPAVFVFSVLGGKCNPVDQPACQEMIADYFEKYGHNAVTGGARRTATTQLVMLTGEVWSTDGLDERVLLLSTVKSVNRAKHIYLPMASAAFGELLGHSPLSLLTASGSIASKSKFCAYLYARCEHSQREEMYDTLNAVRPVDALGTCAGSSRPPDFTKRASRNAAFYNDDAVLRYAPYKFVLAFENTRAPGYVTEKLVNVLLAGSVPIYWGHSATVSELFNPESFIDCGRFESLQDCAAYVVRVDDSPELYARMLSEPPVTNMTAFNQVFSWHPAVPSRFMADAVLKHFQ